MAEFNRSIAIVVGINQYQNGVKPLRTAVSDATEISQLLKVDHGHHACLLTNQQAALAMLRSLLANVLPKTIQPDDRLLFYFAGHGIVFNSDEDPEGYLIPQNAVLGERYTYLPMTGMHDALTQLPYRHFLVIFDCCFAREFRWSATRDVLVPSKVIHKERYEQFITDLAWQVITSVADDQHALDALALSNQRGQVGQHTSFAQASIQANSNADASHSASHGQPVGNSPADSGKLERLVGIVVVVLLILGVIAGVLFWQKFQNKIPSDQNSPSSSLPTSDSKVVIAYLPFVDLLSSLNR